MWLSLLLPATALAGPLPCTPDGPAPAPVATVKDKRLDEISGVAPADGGLLWVLEDSGNPAELALIDPHGGATVRRVKVLGAENVDWEDLAAGPCPDGRCLYLADIGDNREQRPLVRILRVPEPAADATVVRAEVLPFRYPEGPQNAEGLVVDAAGHVFVVTKRTDSTARVYEVPATFGAAEPVQARLVQTLPVGEPEVPGPFARVTGAALVTPAEDWLLLRSYAALWAFPRAAEGWDAAGRVRLPAAAEPQGEAVTWSDGGYWQLSEAGQQKAPVVVYRRDCASP